MAPYEISHSKNSRARAARAQALVAAGIERGDDPAALIAAILSDHENGDESICAHYLVGDPPAMREMTTASMIWDLGEMTVDLCSGNPCVNERRRFGFDW
jgi:hypothetical protein